MPKCINKKIKLFERNISEKEIGSNEIAIIVVDVWDKHWCKLYQKDNDLLAKKIDSFLKSIRPKMVTIIHAPSESIRRWNEKKEKISETTEIIKSYVNHPARKNVVETIAKDKGVDKIEKEEEKENNHHNERRKKRLPKVHNEHKHFRQSVNKGCHCSPSCAREWPRPWTKQHPSIEIFESDYITAKFYEINSIFKKRNIKKVLFVGGASNFCILDRTFGVTRMNDEKIDCSVIRDLTIAHGEVPAKYDKNELQVGHIEKGFCSTVDSGEIIEQVNLVPPPPTKYETMRDKLLQ